MGRYSKAFSIKKQFQSPNCQSCQGQSRTLKKIVFLELLLRIIEEEKWNLFEKLGQLRTPNAGRRRSRYLRNILRIERIMKVGSDIWWRCESIARENFVLTQNKNIIFKLFSLVIFGAPWLSCCLSLTPAQSQSKKDPFNFFLILKKTCQGMFAHQYHWQYYLSIISKKNRGLALCPQW